MNLRKQGCITLPQFRR